MSDIVLQAQDLHYHYADGTAALNGLELSVKRGERLALMGANGSGKSTLFLCLNGVLRPQTGVVRFAGEPVDYSRKGLLRLRRQVGIVFQDPDRQLFSADVYGELSFGPLNLGLPEPEVRARVEQVIQELNLTDFQHKPVHLLSGGQKKRVAIAGILVMQPQVILFDEPTAALDPLHKRLVQDIIDDLSRRGITIISATHDAAHAMAWADSVAVLHNGKLLRYDTPTAIFTDEALLTQAGLEPPALLRLFFQLTRQGILPAGLPLPHTEAELESLLAKQQ